MKIKKSFAAILSIALFLLVSVFVMSCQSQKPEQKKDAAQATEKTAADEEATQSAVQTFDFENYELGKLPQGWENVMTGKGSLGTWQVLSEKTESGENKVLAQTSMKNFGYHFSIAIAKATNYKDLAITVKFKAIKGEEDQGGGPVWRYQDENNYYICRANPLENNFRVYKVINGNRRQLKSYSLPITSGEWHTIKVEHIGNHIKCFYDDQLYLEADDSTFAQSGKVGLWAKADSYCYFDDLKIERK